MAVPPRTTNGCSWVRFFALRMAYRACVAVQEGIPQRLERSGTVKQLSGRKALESSFELGTTGSLGTAEIRKAGEAANKRISHYAVQHFGLAYLNL